MSGVEVAYAEALLTGGIADFNKSDSLRAAVLFNQTHRKRAMKLDCMIAAAAVMRGARVATTNVEDFRPFTAHGLIVEAVAV